MCLNGKSRKKASDLTIYGYKNSRQEEKTLKGYFIPGEIR